MGIPGLPPPEWFDNVLQSPSTEVAAPKPSLGPGGTFVGGVTNLLNGLSFNLADEGISYLASPIVALGSGMSLGDAKNAVLENVRQNVADFRSEHPYVSFLGDVAGGLYGLGKLGFTSKVENAPKLLNSSLLGKGYAMAKEGGKLGGVYGFGAGEDGLSNRVESAGAGALVGALTAPVLGGAIEGGANVAQWAGRKVSESLPIETLRRLAQNQKGAVGSDIGGVGNSGGGPRGSLTPEELILAKQLKDTPIENILAAKTEMDSALQDQAPLFLPEALKSAKVDRNARFVANYDPSMEFSQAQIRARTADAANRASKLFDINVSSNQGSEGASRLIKAADDIIVGAENARKLQSSPLYRAAYDEVPLIESPNLTELLAKDRVLTQAIKEVKKTANNADFADNSSELLVKVRGEVWDQIEKAKAQGANRTARDLQDTYQRLNNILHSENPALAAADLVHANASKGIDALNDTFLTRLRKMTDDQVNNVSQIFNLPPERIGQLRSTFEEAGKIGDWNAGIRSHLQNLVEGTKEGRNFVDKISGNTLQQAKLKAALGDKAFETVQKGLGLENRFFEGKNKYFAGSSTAGNLEEAANFKKNIGVVKNLLNFDFASLARAFVERGMPEETAQNLAKIYFDPKTGQETLNRIIPLIQQIAKERALSAQLGRTTGGLGALESSNLSPTGKAENQLPRQTATARMGEGRQPQPQKSALPPKEGGTGQSKPLQAEQETPSFKRTSTPEVTQGGFSLAANQRSRDLSDEEIDKIGQFGSDDDQAFLELRVRHYMRQGRPLSQAKSLARDDFRATRKNIQGPGLQDIKKSLDVVSEAKSDLYRGFPDAGQEIGLKEIPAMISKLHPFVQAVIDTESRGNPIAKSKKGAQGLMQVMPFVAEAYGADPLDPRQNLAVGIAELEKHLNRFGDARLALAAYNAGPTRVANLIKRVGSSRFESIYPYLPRETQKYVGTVEQKFRSLVEDQTYGV